MKRILTIAVRPRRVLAAFLCVATFAIFAGQACADTYTLGKPNSGLSGLPGPYGTVDVTWVDSTHATVLLTALNQGTHNYLFGDGSTIGLNINGTVNVAAAIASIVTTQPATINGDLPNTPSFSDGGSGTVDGWGSFNFILDNIDGATHAVKTLSFTLTATGTTSWADAAAVLTANSEKGVRVVGHVFDYDTDYNASGVTGYAANGFNPGPPVPEPSTIALACIGLGGLSYRVLRRKTKA